jgi:hypothetical protein
MDKGEACKRLTTALQHCTAAQFSAVREILKLGGRVPVVETRRLSWPANVPQERREILVTLMDAIYQHEKAEDRPMRHGGLWEYAVATLLVERQWQAIRRAAAALKSEASSRYNVTTPAPARARRATGSEKKRRRQKGAGFSRLRSYRRARAT